MLGSIPSTMRDRASTTAEFVCLMRALGPDDPYAARLLSRPLRRAERAWRRLDALGVPVDAATLGLRTLINARHRFIDEALSDALAAGASQVVLLGAGLDARPWRFADGLVGRTLFLVDHPATAARRAARARRLPPVDARRVDVDFAREDFGDALLAAGFDPERPAFFAWEGVSMYLDRATVEAALRRLRALCAPGAALAFDLWRPDAGGWPVRSVVALSVRGMALWGEPVRFGLPTAEVATFVRAAGFEPARVEVPAAGPWSGLTFVSALPAPVPG